MFADVRPPRNGRLRLGHGMGPVSIAHLRGLCRNLINPRTEAVQILLWIAPRRRMRRMERQHLVDLPAYRGPFLRGCAVLLDLLTETEPCLQAREDSCNHGSSTAPTSEVHHRAGTSCQYSFVRSAARGMRDASPTLAAPQLHPSLMRHLAYNLPARRLTVEAINPRPATSALNLERLAAQFATSLQQHGASLPICCMGSHLGERGFADPAVRSWAPFKRPAPHFLVALKAGLRGSCTIPSPIRPL